MFFVLTHSIYTENAVSQRIGIGFTRGQAVRYGLRFFLNSTGIMSIPKPPLLSTFKHNIHIVYTIRDATITSASYYK